MKCILTALALFFISNQSLSITLELSKNKVDIKRNFQGTTIVAFGIIDDNSDIIIVAKGDFESLKVKKIHKNIHNIWTIENITNFKKVPKFYSIYTNQDIHSILDERTINNMNLILSGLDMSEVIKNNKDAVNLEKSHQAILDQKEKHSLFFSDQKGVNRVENSNLFKVAIRIPDRMSTGRYMITAYEVKNRKIVSSVSLPIVVRKIGVNGTLYNLSQNFSKTYAFLAIYLAITFGWICNYIIQAVAEQIKRDVVK